MGCCWVDCGFRLQGIWLNLVPGDHDPVSGGATGLATAGRLHPIRKVFAIRHLFMLNHILLPTTTFLT